MVRAAALRYPPTACRLDRGLCAARICLAQRRTPAGAAFGGCCLRRVRRTNPAPPRAAGQSVRPVVDCRRSGESERSLHVRLFVIVSVGRRTDVGHAHAWTARGRSAGSTDRRDAAGMAASATPSGLARGRELRDHGDNLVGHHTLGSVSVSNDFAHRLAVGTAARRPDDRGPVRRLFAVAGRHAVFAPDRIAGRAAPSQSRRMRVFLSMPATGFRMDIFTSEQSAIGGCGSSTSACWQR